jgi:hypothetical protein
MGYDSCAQANFGGHIRAGAGNFSDTMAGSPGSIASGKPEIRPKVSNIMHGRGQMVSSRWGGWSISHGSLLGKLEKAWWHSTNPIYPEPSNTWITQVSQRCGISC